MYDRIVLAVDGSDEAKHAAQRGLHLARAFDATVDVLAVVDRRALRLTRTADERTELRDRGQAALAEIDELSKSIGHGVTTTLTEGKPAVEIRNQADEQEADLIVVGRQGLTGLGRRLLGGVTEQLLHRSNVPVLVVPGDADSDESPEYANILLPTDGSDNAEVAIPHSIAVASRLNAVVHALYVVDLQAAGGLFNAGGLEPEFIERLEAEGNKAVDRAATKLRESAPELTVKLAVERTASFEGAAAGIRDYIEANHIDLVVMGTHGRSNLKRQMLGSTASTVLRTVDVPVLVVKRPA